MREARNVKPQMKYVNAASQNAPAAEGAVQGDQPSFSVVKVRLTPSERQTIVPLRSVR